MPAHIETLGIDQLTVSDRLELIDQIWESLPEHLNPYELPAWHLLELAKRRAEAEASPNIGTPWREALARFGTERRLSS